MFWTARWRVKCICYDIQEHLTDHKAASNGCAPPAGGDAFISICMWQAGFAVTDPGYSFYHPEIQMMDPGPEDRLGIMMKLARALDANRCDERCRVSTLAHQTHHQLKRHNRP